MKHLNTIIAALTLAMGMTSCSQEDMIEQAEAETPKAPVKVQAVTEDAAATRTTYDRDDNYRVLWSEGDKIKFVSKADASVVYYFTLSSEAGQPDGEFTLDAGQADLADGEYMVYYPATWEGLTEEGNVRVLPRQEFKLHEPNDISGAPMKATATVSNGGTTISDLVFTNVAGVVSYFAIMDSNKPLYNIVIKAERANGWPEYNPVAVFNCRGVNARNMDMEFAIKPGIYENVTLEYNAMDGSKAVKKAENMIIERNKLYRAVFTDLTFGEPVKIVDMGVIKIADRNLGAASPEDFGDYYCFGETELKTLYLKDDITYTGTSTIPLENDAARACWGGSWRLPTDFEVSFIIPFFDWLWTDNYNDTGVAGYIVTSKETGNSIFLPQALSSDTDGCRKSGLYWTASTPVPAEHINAVVFSISKDSHNTTYEIRSRGLPIRPVWMPSSLQ